MKDEQYRLLKQIAGQRRRPVTGIVREALAEYVAKHAQPVKPPSIGKFKSRLRNLGKRADALLTGFGEDQ